MANNWEVIVGNVGCVYSGPDETEARNAFDNYTTASDLGKGRVAGEDVTLMKDGEPEAEFVGAIARELATHVDPDAEEN